MSISANAVTAMSAVFTILFDHNYNLGINITLFIYIGEKEVDAACL